MDRILGHRPIVTSLSSVINSSGWYEVIHLNYCLRFKGKCGGFFNLVLSFLHIVTNDEDIENEHENTEHR